MTAEDRTFVLNLVNLVILAIVGFLTKQGQVKTDALNLKMDENHKLTNSRMDEALKTAEEKWLLIGEERGRIKAQEENVVRETALAAAATTAALLQIAQTAPAALPLPTELAAIPLPVKVVAEEPVPATAPE